MGSHAGVVSFLVSFAGPEERVQPVCDVSAEASSDVRVSLDHRTVRPAHDIHDGPLRDAQEQQGCRGRVTGVMQPGLPDSSLLQQRLPLVLITARIYRLTVRL